MRAKLCFVLSILVISGTVAFAQVPKDTTENKLVQLEKRIKILEEKLQQKELEDLIREAETKAKSKTEIKKRKVFKSGQRALQAINPEISVTGDIFGTYNPGNKDASGAYLRVLGIHIQSNLDPFSLAKATVEFNPEGVELGEAYMTWTNFLPNVSLSAGKFRQNFGIVNRWHAHSLDQFDYPLALTTIFGEDGLNQIGLSFNWLMPSLFSGVNNLTFEVTDGLNGNLFAGKTFTFPVLLAHLKNYWDLSENSYLEFGLTGMYGKNKVPKVQPFNIIEEVEKNSYVGGLDLTYFWQPVNKALYKSFVWRTELYYAQKELIEPNKIKAFGGYSYIQYQLNEKWFAGARFDYTQPFKIDNSNESIVQIVPYLVWWQSHWVRLRLQYNYLKYNFEDSGHNSLNFQITWALGPHKHERY